MRRSVVFPVPLRPDRVSRSRRSSLNDTPRKSGLPAMSLPRSDAIATAIGLMVGAVWAQPEGGCLGLSWSATALQRAIVGESGEGLRSLTTRLPHAGQKTGMRATVSFE